MHSQVMKPSSRGGGDGFLTFCLCFIEGGSLAEGWVTVMFLSNCCALRWIELLLGMTPSENNTLIY